MRIVTRRGLDVGLPGAPRQEIEEAPPVASAAVLGDDHRMLRPSVLVAVGQRVRLGQRLIEDRRNPGLVVTAPGTGVVTAIIRGERRVLRSVEIALEDQDEEEPLTARRRSSVAGMTRDEAVGLLVDGGLWPAIRRRPFGRAPPVGTTPDALFVTATDTNPLAAHPEVVIAPHAAEFEAGLDLVARLTDGPVYLCRASGSPIPGGDPQRITSVDVSGPHPSGLAGTHIHHLAPVGFGRVVWHIGYQDVIAAGHLATTGRRSVERVVALGGAHARNPRLLRTRLGACIDDLVAGGLADERCRVVSGSALCGRQATGWARHMGWFHLQICALAETAPVAEHGHLAPPVPPGPGTFVPTPDFERVLPLDLLPAPLLRALVAGDHDAARELGCLELDDEDLALCSYVCPGRIEYGPLLSRTLAELEGRP